MIRLPIPLNSIIESIFFIKKKKKIDLEYIHTDNKTMLLDNFFPQKIFFYNSFYILSKFALQVLKNCQVKKKRLTAGLFFFANVIQMSMSLL